MEEEDKEEKPELVTKVSRFLPAVSKPEYKQSLNRRLKWTGLALLLYLLLSYITVYGLAPSSYQQFRFFEIVLGSKMGSIMTLGIGPIVTAGIILQLLVGSKIIKWDTTKSEGRKKFQVWNKVLAITFCVLEAIVFVLAGAIPVVGGTGLVLFVILQLAAGGIIIIILDELVTKWGFGSGVSLFIAAGVATQIVIGLISPLSAEGRIAGAIPGFLAGLIGGNFQVAISYLLPILSTAFVLFIVIYTQGIGVDIPLVFSSLRGFGRTWTLKFFYAGVIAFILTTALIANIQLMGRFGVKPTETGLRCGFMGCFDQQDQAVNGIVYYLSAPTNLLLNIVSGTLIPSDVLRALIYTVFLALGAMIFSIFWVNTAGMDAKSVAKQLDSTGMQIPGYRKDIKIMESVLNRYIPALTILGGLSIGLLAAFADLLGAIGSGTGILLTVMIIYNYYEQLKHEKVEEAHPIIRKIVGE